jgi:hypothetical protein
LTLQEIDHDISELKRTAMSLASTSPSQTFYRHMAEGASPQILVSDLKGQLDLLTSRMLQDAR